MGVFYVFLNRTMVPDRAKHYICFVDPTWPCLDLVSLNILLKQTKNGTAIGHDHSPKFHPRKFSQKKVSTITDFEKEKTFTEFSCCC